MKRIALLVCGLVLVVVANTAEARRGRSNGNYYQPAYSQPVTVQKPVTTAPAPTTAPATEAAKAQPVKATPVSLTTTTTATATTAKAATATTVVKSKFDTSSAQGVANIMAANGYVGHFGGNPGYEGCGMAGTKEGAYAICCYANSGMATVDVGYAQGSNGMWYCCRRYR
ncbi:hypothetical protein [Anatilimnocola floriformis]|uniref:hypothetical protein n=1 Tax=Anatilimnocola floriformis TaxID=2948575 RepID=UPI0020C56E89|nr:hypothetical protein [Anatilimnocola floriformis]